MRDRYAIYHDHVAPIVCLVFGHAQRRHRWDAPGMQRYRSPICRRCHKLMP